MRRAVRIIKVGVIEAADKRQKHVNISRICIEFNRVWEALVTSDTVEGIKSAVVKDFWLAL